MMSEGVPQPAEATDWGALAERIVQSKGRDRKAEEALCGAFARRIRLYGLRHLRDSPAADDFTQEVLIIVLEALRSGRIDDPTCIAAYVLGTCRSVVRDWRRNHARRDGLLASHLAELLPTVELPEPPLDRARLGQCLDRLPSRERQVIYDSFVLEKDNDRIATFLETSPGNVRVLRHRAIVRLRGCLNNREGA